MATKIFLIDDDIKYLTLLKFHIEENVKHPIDVHIFAYGENALDKLDLNPEIVVVDYYLDGINESAANGVEITKKIKDKLPTAHVVLITSKDEVSVVKDSLDKGAYSFISKTDTTFLKVHNTINNIIKFAL